MRWALVIITITLLTGFSNPLSAQQYIFKNYTVNDGLVANYIHRIYQDSKGFLWIATWEGLSKYDGYQFTNYNTSNGLSHNTINDFYESKNGELYIATNGGGLDKVSGNKLISRAIPSTVIVNRFLKSPNHPVIVSTDGNGLHEFKEGKLIKPTQASPEYSYNNIATLNDSLFIASSNYSIQVLDLNYKLYADLVDTNSHSPEKLVYKDSKNRIWTGAHAGLKLLMLPVQRNKPLIKINPPFPFAISALQKNKINDIFEDADGIIWIGTTAGLVRINPAGFHQLITTKEGLVSDNITSIFQDKEKNIWFGTTSGLSKLVANSDIRIYKTGNGLLSNNMYFTVPSRSGYLLAGGDKGVQLFNKESGNFTTVSKNDDEVFLNVISTDKSLLLLNNNKMVLFDTASLKISENSSFDLGKLKLRLYTHDKNENLFAGDDIGLYFLSAKSTVPKVFLQRRVTALLFDKQGYLWIGTWDDGLYRIKYSADNDSFRILSNIHYLENKFIRSLFEDAEGNIWAGTRYDGVFQIAKNALISILNFNQNTGLTSNWVTNITEDRKGNIWLAFYMGLDKLIKQDNSYRVFNFSRISNFFTPVVSMGIDDEGIMWLATTEGMVQITDNEIDKLPPLPVYITKVISSDSLYTADAEMLKLDYHHDQIQFEFSSPGFINEKQIVYSYRLSGSSNPEWKEAGNQHSISYANLEAGDYRFEVRCRGWNSAWGKPAGFSFSISPPFWETTLFRIAGIALIAAVVYYFFRRRIAEVRHEAEMNRKIAETEMMALRAQMNPHFIFNCINSIDALIQSNDKYHATVYLNKFAKLIRNILDSSKQNVVALSKDIETLQLYIDMEQFRYENKFTAKIEAEPSLLQDDYKVPPLIIQPYVENAILHGLKNRVDNEGRLAVSVKRQNGQIEFIIEDNGVGRSNGSESKLNDKRSYGMQMSKDRIKIFNKEEIASVLITDLEKDGKAAGTKVQVLLNIQ